MLTDLKIASILMETRQYFVFKLAGMHPTTIFYAF